MALSLSKEAELFSMRKDNKDKIKAYEKQMETYTMRNAVMNDYFQTLTLEDVLGQREAGGDSINDDDSSELNGDISNRESSRKDSFDDIRVIRFRNSRLKSVGIINQCRNLTICDLSCNYLQRIDPLIHCKSLVKLDVHQNQISEIPGEHFWFNMSNLSIVYLHNNGISTFDELQKLTTAQCLTILTLQDTPISIKPHYRHFVTNSILSLKALDNVVISDEELIEDANFNNNFRAMQPHFSFKPKSLLKKTETTLEEEKQAVNDDVAHVNKIQSKYCPVLIIQRHIRGFLIRMRYQYFLDTRLWAAVTIQRFYRKYKGLDFHGLNVSSSELPYLSLSSPRLDYETYMKYRKSTLSQINVTEANSRQVSELFRKNIFYESAHNAARPTVRLNINLNKLAASTARIAEESQFEVKSGQLMRTSKPRDSSKSTADLKPDDIDLKSLSKSSGIDFVPFDKTEEKKDKKYSGKYFTQHQFLGPVKTVSDKYEKIDRNVDITDEESQGKIPFRLSIKEPPKLRDDYVEETMMKTIEIARDIRETMRDFERQRAALPKPVVEKRSPVTMDQKLFIRTHGTMALTCFRAINQAYKDRDRAEMMSNRAMRVREMKQAREMSSEMLKQTKSANIERIVAKNAHIKRELTSVLQDNEEKFMERQKTYVSQRTASRSVQKRVKNNRQSLNEFVCQNNAVVKALAKHAITSSKEKTTSGKAEKLETIRCDVGRQKEVIKRFYEHRSLVLQSEYAIARSKLNDQLTQQTEERKKEAKLRVTKLKSQTIIKPAPIIGVATAPPRLPPLAIVAEKQWGEWEKTPKKEIKSRIHDRVSIWT